MTNDVETVRTWLHSSYSLTVPSDWLDACIEWIQQEHGDQRVPIGQLQAMVFEQWLMSDLKELGASCLPEDLSSHLSTIVNGPLALQVESMLDVGVPLYGQLQTVRGTLNTNTDVSADKPLQPAWEPKPSRMLLLTLTDGQTQIQGMEYRPIPHLNPSLQPGFKVVVQGQVKCRRGVLMLTSESLQVLGGEVDSLIETNTPVAVLERAMEQSKVNNGKHAKKDFSGRFHKQQGYKTDYGGKQDQKFKTEIMSSQQKPVIVGGGYGMSNRGGHCSGTSVKNEQQSQKCGFDSGDIKTEPLSQAQINSLDDEWEEDLDYGQLMDEAMAEELYHQPTVSQPAPTSSSTNTTTTIHKLTDPMNRNPFACPPSTSAHTNSGNTNSWPRSEWKSPINQSSATGVDKTKTSNGLGLRQLDHVSSQSSVKQSDDWIKMDESTLHENKGDMIEDCAWDDDDDFDLVQADADIVSPVIPLQTSTGENLKKSVNVSTHKPNLSLQDSKNANPQMLTTEKTKNSFGSNKPLIMQNSQNTATTTQHSGLLHTNQSSPLNVVKPITKSSSLNKIDTKSGKNSLPKLPSVSSQAQKSIDTKPPPPKQRKLTTMFSRAKPDNQTQIQENKSQTISTVSHHSPGSVVDLTEDVASTFTCSSKENGSTLSQSGNLAPEIKSDRVCRPAEKALPLRAASEECQDVEMLEEKDDKDGGQTYRDKSNRAVIPPLNSQESLVSSCPESQTVKSVLSLIQSGETCSCTIKGYITTLTDRLRSCLGNQWSLSCRITDGTATLDVSIADKVLSKLIGFSAEESITLRQQARKDASIKQFLTQGLQQCQKSLIEFSGLIDVQLETGESKPTISNMVQLEVKKR